MYIKPMPLDRQLHCDLMTQYDNVLKTPDLFGLEVELEGVKIKTNKAPISNYWGQHVDNSLRALGINDEAIEYVLIQPNDLKNTYEAVKALFDYLNSPGVVVYDSYRTSIHVHLSCMLETHRTIYNFMTLAMIFDELLVSQNGAHRIGNNFCLRTKDAQGQVEDVIASVQTNGSFFGINGQHRYSSVNFVSLLKFGTIEFRSMECMTDIKRMVHWIDTLQRLKVMARTYADPQEIIRSFSQKSGLEFVYHILGPCAEKYAAVPNWERMLQHGMRLAQDLAYCSKWVAHEQGEQEPPSKPKVAKKPKGLFAGFEAMPMAAPGAHWGQQPPHPWGVDLAGLEMGVEHQPAPQPAPPAAIDDWIQHAFDEDD